MKTPLLILLAGAALAPLAACEGDFSTLGPALPDNSAVGGEHNTFDHPGPDIDVWELLERAKLEGPARYAARVHSCPKMKYATLGNLLASRGVDLANPDPSSAGGLYRAGDQALGAANFSARQREGRELSTATASRMFDIFVQAAPEIIANLASRPECQIDGVGVDMFNAANQCNLDAITCLLGVPATPSHLELCNLAVSRATDVEKGKRLAVASLLAAAHTCE